MKTYNLRHVKREIRVLGLAVEPAKADGLFHVVGVVYRGKLFLDGVMRTTASGPEITGDVVEMIRASPHHPQIRVILLDGDLMCERASIDPCGLSSGTSKPVIALGLEADTLIEDEAVQQFTLKRGETSLLALSVGLRDRVALRVLEMASRGDEMPEALRVAGLVVSALSRESHT